MRKARLLQNLQKCTLGGLGLGLHSLLKSVPWGGLGAGATQLAQKCTLGGAGGLGAGAGVGHELREIAA